MAAPRASRVAWAARPRVYSRRIWALLLALDRLPWPRGEDIMGVVFTLDALVRFSRVRAALAWAAAHRSTRGERRRLALETCRVFGRFVARAAYTGIHDLATLRRLVRLEGEAHLAGAGPGAILLGFHLGPMSPDVALRLAGHRVTWIALSGVWRGGGAAWPDEIRRLYESSTAADPASRARQSSRPIRGLHLLYLTHRILRSGENVYVTADTFGDTLVFDVRVPGGAVKVRQGWLLLRELTGAPVLPVLARMEGRTLVTTIHPPLPARVSDPDEDLAACREILARLLEDYVRAAPEQCYVQAFEAVGIGVLRRRPTAGAAVAGRS